MKAVASQAGPIEAELIAIALVKTTDNAHVAGEVLQLLQDDGSVTGGKDKTRPRFKVCTRCARVPLDGLT